MKKFAIKTGRLACLTLLVFTSSAHANIPGGGTGNGPNVTVVDNGDGTVTMGNGIISIHIVKSGASINQINYTYNNSGPQTQQVLAGGKNGGEFYWEFGGWGGSTWAYSVVANNGNYAEVSLLSDSATNGQVEVHFSMLRGSTGFYATPIWSHRAQDAAMTTGEERDNIYFAPYFNWMSVNDQVQHETGINATFVPAFYSPQENSLCTSGVMQGTYDDKYKWSADFGVERVWGWSSVSDPAIGLVGQNIGIWHVVASAEFYNGGPLKPELNDAPMVNMINGGHYYFGNDSGFASGETWTRVSGPYFIYFNNVTNTLTDPGQTSQALYADAKAQADAEISAWPYSWMTNASYAPSAQRGAVAGQIVINDIYNPNASASNLWVGVEQQPSTLDNVFDFQLWMKPYEFWVQTDANGNFTIPNVIAGTNYTLYAFGPGAAGTFISKNQNGGNPNLLYNLASPQFTVVVTGGATNNLGAVTWTPVRVGPTVFEIGYPSRKGDKFRHGDDYWVGDLGPSPTAPSPVWTKFLEFPFDFPNGLNYVVGQSRWNTDWNFIQSVYPDYGANNIVTSSTVTFNLLAAPPGGTMASLYLGIASDDNTPIYVTVNGTLLSSANATGAPQTSLPNTGWFPMNDISDTNIREENHGAFSDERLMFPASLLNTNGVNTINFSFRQAGGSGFSHHFIYDYIRLELPGYVPPAPASVTPYPGNDSVLLSWPVTPGATSYNILRSTNSGGTYALLTNGVTGPVCGSGPANATYIDNTAANATTYYYVVQSVNPVDHSGNSPQSSGVAPSAGISSGAPPAPTGLTITSTNNTVTLVWNSSAGANFYSIQRGTVVNKLGYVPLYSTLNNTTPGTTYTDASGTLGCTYSYIVSATGAGGTSTNSPAVTAKPVPPPPSAPPANIRLTDTITSSNQTTLVTWLPVNGAVGYILEKSINGGIYAYVQSMMTTNYTDGGLTTNTLYSYRVYAMNAGGTSTYSSVASTPPLAPASLNAYAGNAQIQLVWPASAGATNYVIKRGGASGGEATLTVTTGTTYTDTGLANGITYYYIVIANGTGGSSLSSPEASATPFFGPPAIYWINNLTSAAQGWNVNSNWSNGTAFPNAGQAQALVNSAIGANQIINLNQSITVGSLSLGASGGSFNITNVTGSLVFDNSPGMALLAELPLSKGDIISAPVSLNTALSISNTALNPLTISGTISGNNGLMLFGPGTLLLSGNNTFSGGAAVSGGTLQLNSATGAGSGVIQLTGGGTLNENNTSIGNVISNAGTNTWTSSGNTTTYPAAALTGSGQLNLNITGSGVFSPGGDWSQFAGTIAWPPGNNAGCRFYGTLGSANAIWNLGSGTGNIYNRNGGITINFGALIGGAGTGISGASTVNAATTFAIGALNLDSTFNGKISDGGLGITALNKVGTGTLILTGTNTFTGGATISGGTLLVNNLGGSGTGSGAVVVANGGTLAGGGIISGAVTVQSGGALAPGNPLGPLTINNNLSLAAGSTAFLQVQPSPLTNDLLKISGTLTEGGTLKVTNYNGTVFAAGDNFKLFTAGNYSGAFANFSLPGLASNLTWNTTRLNMNGSLWVVSTVAPNITQTVFAGAGFVFAGTGGTPNWNYFVLTTTNLVLPVSQWTRAATNQFDAAGNFACTNSISAGQQQIFFEIQTQ